MLHSYPPIYAVGHRYAVDIFKEPVVVQEKVDGSQFSFGLVDGELQCRSKGQALVVDAPEKLFKRAVEAVIERKDLLHPGWTYRAECVDKPKHNVLVYERVPKGNLIVYDIMIGEQDYHAPAVVAMEAERLGLEVVPTYYQGITSGEDLKQYLGRVSVLGGSEIEGVVAKSYSLFGLDKKPLMVKLVRADFQEKNSKAWRASNPTKGDVVAHLIDTYRTDARFQKALQILRENGGYTQSPQDIGPLMRVLEVDLLKEYREEIAEALFKEFWPHIIRGVRAGLPEWYKEQLMRGDM